MASKQEAEASDSPRGHKRGRIASQACERCRARKSKCDEQKPQCAATQLKPTRETNRIAGGSCQAENKPCVYTETVAARLERVEDAIAHVADMLAGLQDTLGTFVLNSNHSAPVTQRRQESDHEATSLDPDKLALQNPALRPTSAAHLAPPTPYLTVPHRVLLWPCMHLLLTGAGKQVEADLAQISQQGTRWFIKQELSRHPRSLPCSVGPLASNFTGLYEAPGVLLPNLSAKTTMEYTRAYFHTFNVLLPILDYNAFRHDILDGLFQNGYVDGDPATVVALLVFALGELAIEGVFGEPISVQSGTASGFKGGDRANPPGLHLFNEARRRHGFVDSLCELENVQIYVLRAIYYEANAHHLEFWKSITNASLTTQALLKSRPFEWSTPAGDMMGRAYWICVMQEELYHLDLDLPSTGIQQHEDEVPLPLFHSLPNPYVSDSRVSEKQSFFQHHFLAMIALRRLIVRIHAAVHEPSKIRPESSEDYGDAPSRLIREMGRQLDSWRSLLPPALQWLDEDCAKFRNLSLDIPGDGTSTFSSDESVYPFDYDHNVDILTAQLRTRYYYARYILYRPYVFKALHFPERMSASDADHCAIAINSMCLWPFLMAPPKAKKRLTPHLFAWTHNILGMLLIFRAIGTSDCLKQICQEQVSLSRVQETTTLMLEWIRDAKQLDGAAEWGWTIMERLFEGNFW